MSNLPIFDVAGSALQAQSVRMSTIASNLSNADSVAGSAEAAYKPIEPIFQAVRNPHDSSLTSATSSKSPRPTHRRSSATNPAIRSPTPTATSIRPMWTRSRRWST